MCELKVILNGKMMFNKEIYAKQENDQVIVKELSGFTRGFIKSTIQAIHIGTKRFTLKNSK